MYYDTNFCAEHMDMQVESSGFFGQALELIDSLKLLNGIYVVLKILLLKK